MDFLGGYFWVGFLLATLPEMVGDLLLGGHVLFADAAHVALEGHHVFHAHRLLRVELLQVPHFLKTTPKKFIFLTICSVQSETGTRTSEDK